MSNASKSANEPVLLARWYDYMKWLLDRVDGFPKNQRFIFGTRLADAALDIHELLVEASYTREKAELLRRVNVRVEKLRWLVRLAKDRRLITSRQYEYSAEQLTGCGKMLGGWIKNTER
ncbi:diversity-generating retroelement protein Avd [Geminisphaera colitermitum]|uniref:diversity-generating retroelement protein Avd n=1 Tax=Geminisphaera colitermitum TaxID=1148786 RepID=UPI000158D2D9|nr:diversity-generating retroelement protein Avd [Geminisphaera colitermitum]